MDVFALHRGSRQSPVPCRAPHISLPTSLSPQTQSAFLWSPHTHNLSKALWDAQEADLFHLLKNPHLIAQEYEAQGGLIPASLSKLQDQDYQSLKSGPFTHGLDNFCSNENNTHGREGGVQGQGQPGLHGLTWFQKCQQEKRGLCGKRDRKVVRERAGWGITNPVDGKNAIEKSTVLYYSLQFYTKRV